MEEQLNSKEQEEVKEEVNTQIHKHLSTVFVIMGIISFGLGAIVNWYTIKRIKGGGV